jgi:orotidine-5'-phosphate decarboxylase
MQDAQLRGSAKREIPALMRDRLIVALDVASVAQAAAIVKSLDGIVAFFKIGMWLLFTPGVDDLIANLIAANNKVFLDAKMYDVPETVAHGVAAAAARGVTFVTVHGDENILRAAVTAKAGSDLKIFAVTVLTSLDDAALRDMGYSDTARQLVIRRARTAVECQCDGIIASADDNPDEIRRLARSENLLIATPGIRPAGSAVHDQKRVATPYEAIANGADYLVVGRPIVAAPRPEVAAASIIADMERAAKQ